MDELKEYYRKALSAKIEALESARKAYLDRDTEAMETLRRIAHSLAGSGGTYGFPDISKAAKKVEEASEPDILTALSELLALLRDYSNRQEVKRDRILVVEDDPEISFLLKSKLADKNREVIFAETGEEAEQILGQDNIALVILDLILPDYDGRNILISIRENPRTAGLPVVIITGKSNAHVQSECYGLGADVFFEKPFDPDALTAAVANKIHQVKSQKALFTRDQLTGLPNRASFMETLEQSKKVAIRNKTPLTLAFLDIDHFKSINDTYGHSTGDTVLKQTAEIISSTLRSSDVLARWGGEEFVALFQDTPTEGAVNALEKALANIREYKFEHEGEPFSVTFSGGITQVQEDEPLKESINRADQLLYHAKDAGRNRLIAGAIPPEKTPGKIFLAEDDDLIASVVKHRLEKAEYSVDHYSDGLQAYDGAKSNGQYSLYILDVKMPGMDGFELLKNIRKIPASQEAPIVMLTSMGSEKDVVRGFSLGADDYILKPFSPNELISRVNRLLKKS